MFQEKFVIWSNSLDTDFNDYTKFWKLSESFGKVLEVFQDLGILSESAQNKLGVYISNCYSKRPIDESSHFPQTKGKHFKFKHLMIQTSLIMSLKISH